MLEYRTSRIGLLFVLLLLGVLAPFIIPIPLLWWWLQAEFRQEQAIIREFLQAGRVAHEAGVPLVRTQLKIGYDAQSGFYADHD